MLHSVPTVELEETLGIGGTVLPMILPGNAEHGDDPISGSDHSTRIDDHATKTEGALQQTDEVDTTTSAALLTDCAVYFGGDIMKAAKAVIDRKIDEGEIKPRCLGVACVWIVSYYFWA